MRRSSGGSLKPRRDAGTSYKFEAPARFARLILLSISSSRRLILRRLLPCLRRTGPINNRPSFKRSIRKNGVSLPVSQCETNSQESSSSTHMYSTSGTGGSSISSIVSASSIVSSSALSFVVLTALAASTKVWKHLRSSKEWSASTAASVFSSWARFSAATSCARFCATTSWVQVRIILNTFLANLSSQWCLALSVSSESESYASSSSISSSSSSS
mmetsp:Transcript_23784/g.37324  ORF Transcript_23784/g.37324 Transcript_23784/m.37324 type:complete len:216 (+) Transcript_23784:204-851(+)